MRRVLSVLLALTIGGVGGWAANRLQLPLAWMIGAMTATTAAAIAGAPITLPLPLRSVMVAVLGVMLGSGFAPEILDRLGEWTLSLAALLGYTAVAGAAGMVYFRRVAGYERATAYFAATPGGLSEMVLIGGTFGGDSRIISLVHASRVLMVVLTLPFAFRVLLDYEPGSRPAAGPDLLAMAPGDLAILAACGVIGFAGARFLRIPAAAIVGPMLLSAAAHLAGLTAAKPPDLLVALSQVVVGTSIGCRFAGTAPALLGRTVLHAAGGTVILVIVTLVFSLALNWLTGLPLAALVLAFAPGGLAEMSLIALAMSLDAAFVATHHLLRIFVIVVFAPSLFRAGSGKARSNGG